MAVINAATRVDLRSGLYATHSITTPKTAQATIATSKARNTFNFKTITAK